MEESCIIFTAARGPAFLPVGWREAKKELKEWNKMLFAFIRFR
jgi:hypothetical protein